MYPQFILIGVILIFIITVISVNLEGEHHLASTSSKKFNKTYLLQNEHSTCSKKCFTQFFKSLWFDNGCCGNYSTVSNTSTAEPANIEECKRIGDNTCKHHDECCSRNCFIQSGWKMGICKKTINNTIEYVEPANIEECKQIGDNTCTHHDECCSRNCFMQPGWKMGICKKTINNTIEYERTGRCSYYEYGSVTASGEPFHPWALTAAHRTLPFNTTVRVKTPGSRGRSVLVRVNDRGPFVRGRILDLSRGAAELLGTVRAGVVWCYITVVGDTGGDHDGGGQACKKNWDNTCVKNDECCSAYCDRPPEWARGVCKSAHSSSGRPPTSRSEFRGPRILY